MTATEMKQRFVTKEVVAINGGEVTVWPVASKQCAILVTDFAVKPSTSASLESLPANIATVPVCESK